MEKGSLAHTDKDERNNLLFTRGSESAIPLIFFWSLLSRLICTDCLRRPTCSPISKLMWWLYQWNCVRVIPLDNYRAVAYLIEATVSSGCPLSSPVPQWHVVLGQHDREFTAQRIMATSSPQGSEIYCPFPVLYWVRLQTRSLHGAGWAAWRLSGYRPTARRCCPGSLCEKLPPTVKDHVCPRVETHRFLSDLAIHPHQAHVVQPAELFWKYVFWKSQAYFVMCMWGNRCFQKQPINQSNLCLLMPEHSYLQLCL